LIRYIILIISALFSYAAHAQNVISVPADNEVLRLYSGFEVATDRQGLLTIDDVLSGALAFKTTQLPFSGGYTRNTHWFRFSVQQKETSPSSWILIAGPKYTDRLELYSPSKDSRSGYMMIAKGDTIAASQHPLGLQYGSHSFLIHLDDEHPQTFYLKMQSHNTSALHLALASKGSFSQFNSTEMLFSGFILGALLLLIINAFNAWRWLKQPTYLLIIGYAVGAIFHRIALNGLIPQYLLPDSPSIVNALAPMGTCFLVGFLMTFFIFFYDTRKLFPRLHYLFTSVLLLSLATLLSIPFDYFVTLAPYLLLATLLLFPILLYVTWKGIKLNIIGSHAVFTGYLIYVILVTTTILSTTGFIPVYPIMLEMPQIASVVFLFSIQQGMFRQTKRFEIEKLAAELMAIEATEKAEDEKQRRQNQSIFMTMIAHEIHTPLSVIDSAIQTIEMTKPELGTLISERHNRIRNSVDQLNQLLENTLTAESNDARPLHPEIESIQADLFMADSLQNSLSKASCCKIDIALDCMISADPKLLKHIVSNLLVNAEKYSPNGSGISLSVEKQERNNHAGTLISIQNSYIARTKPDPSRWLNKYFRQTVTPNIYGFGLGLYLVEKITSAHQGEITIDISSIKPDWLVTVAVWLPDTDIKNN
jgi:signal transduction histidine kinase